MRRLRQCKGVRCGVHGGLEVAGQLLLVQLTRGPRWGAGGVVVAWEGAAVCFWRC